MATPPEAIPEAVPEAVPATTSHEGFVIEAVEMAGFMRYLHRTTPPITFPAKFTAITGPTGAGKTTLLDAITFALYKRSTRTDIQGIKIAELCRPGGHVRLDFHQGGSTYTVRRGFASTGAPQLELRRDEKPIRGTIPELEATIQDVIGLDYDGFRNSTFVRQEEMKRLGADRPSERLEVFQKLFRLETFEKAAEVAKERLDRLRGEVQGAEGELLVFKDQLSQLEPLQEEVRTWKVQAESSRAELGQAEQELTTALETLAKLERDHETYLQAQATLQSLRSGVEELEAQLAEKRQVLAALPEMRERTDGLAAEVDGLSQREAEAQDLMDRQQRRTLVRKELESVEARRTELGETFRALVADLEGKVQAEEERLAALSTDLGAEKAFALLKEEGTLEERVTRIDRELEWLADRVKLSAALRREQESSRAALETVQGQTAHITREAFLHSEIEEGIAALREELGARQTEWQQRMAEMDEAQRDLEAKVEASAYGAAEKKRLATLREALEGLEEKRELLRKAREELQRMADLETLIAEMEGRAEQKRSQLEEVHRGVARAETAEESYQAARAEVETLRAARDTTAKALFEAEASLKATQTRLEELEALRGKQEEVGSRLERLRAQAEVYSILREGVFHRKGVVMYAINRLLPELEIETSRNLNDLTNGRLQRVKLETHEEARGYGIRILVEGVDGEWHDVGIFSGGERTQINAALRFAIAKELASMPQVGRTYGRMKTLFIDEGDLGSLDTESSRELFVAKLFKMGEAFEKVILITHLSEVAERFPGRIRVTMTPEGESRAEVVA